MTNNHRNDDDDDDDDNSYSIRNLDHAPEPPSSRTTTTSRRLSLTTKSYPHPLMASPRPTPSNPLVLPPPSSAKQQRLFLSSNGPPPQRNRAATVASSSGDALSSSSHSQNQGPRTTTNNRIGMRDRIWSAPGTPSRSQSPHPPLASAGDNISSSAVKPQFHSTTTSSKALSSHRRRASLPELPPTHPALEDAGPSLLPATITNTPTTTSATPLTTTTTPVSRRPFRHGRSASHSLLVVSNPTPPPPSHNNNNKATTTTPGSTTHTPVRLRPSLETVASPRSSSFHNVLQLPNLTTSSASSCLLPDPPRPRASTMDPSTMTTSVLLSPRPQPKPETESQQNPNESETTKPDPQNEEEEGQQQEHPVEEHPPPFPVKDESHQDDNQQTRDEKKDEQDTVVVSAVAPTAVTAMTMARWLQSGSEEPTTTTPTPRIMDDDPDDDPMIFNIESYNSLPDDKEDHTQDTNDDEDSSLDFGGLPTPDSAMANDDDDEEDLDQLGAPPSRILATAGGRTITTTPHATGLDDSVANWSWDEHDDDEEEEDGPGPDDDDDDDDDDDESSSYYHKGTKRKKCRLTMHQISTFVVIYAPCFWVWYGLTSLGDVLCFCTAQSSSSQTKGGGHHNNANANNTNTRGLRASERSNQWALRRRQPTDRAILARLNVLVGVFALMQIAAALFFTIVTLTPNTRVVQTGSSNTTLVVDDETVAIMPMTTTTTTETDDTDDFLDDTNDTLVVFSEEQEEQRRGWLGGGSKNVNIWNTGIHVTLLGVEAFILVLAALMTVRVVRNVNLVGAIRYLWVLLWILPFQIFFNIGLYDYFRVTDVWVRHYWRDETMGWFREKYCKPAFTANTLCTVPLGVNETEWCLTYYNATSCSAIRNKAQQDTESFLLVFYYTNASWGLVLICLLFLVVNTLEGIISKPLVRKSRQSNVPAWLSLPIVSCIIFGLVYTYAETSGLSARSDTDGNWIGPLYMATAGLFLMAALLGWYISVSSITNTRHKRNKLICIVCFIILMTLIVASLIALFAASVAFSSSFVDIPLTDSQRGDLACFLDQAASCTNCDLPQGDPNRCPEWTVSDVTKVIQTQAKSSASLAAILMLYAFSALRFGWAMRKHIRMYQIQYV